MLTFRIGFLCLATDIVIVVNIVTIMIIIIIIIITVYGS